MGTLKDKLTRKDNPANAQPGQAMLLLRREGRMEQRMQMAEKYLQDLQNDIKARKPGSSISSN